MEAMGAKSEGGRAGTWVRCSVSLPARKAKGTYQAIPGTRGEEGAAFLAIKLKKILAFRYARHDWKEETDYGAGKKTACRP